jgi:Domain of unknown function (DUF4860)
MRKSPLQTLVVLFMITLFIVGSGIVVITGAQFYTKMVKESDLSLTQHSALLYFNNRIKQHDAFDKISLVTQNGITALCFKQDAYYTLVYESKGYLVEQSSESNTISLLEAQNILPLSELSFTLNTHDIVITYLDQNGKEITLTFALLSQRGAS